MFDREKTKKEALQTVLNMADPETMVVHMQKYFCPLSNVRPRKDQEGGTSDSPKHG